MPQDFTLHTHTLGFDGKNIATEMIDKATDCGMRTVGISNHLIVHPYVTKSAFYPHAVSGGYSRIYNTTFDDALSEFKAHYGVLDMIAFYKQNNITVLRGMELDLFDNHAWHNGYKHMRNVLKPDYIIGACHLIEYGGRLCNIHDMKNASAEDQDKMLAAYWDKVQWIAKSGLCTFLAHIDLPCRLGLGSDEKWIDTEEKTTDIIAQTKIPVEINTALYKYGTHPHPSPRIMKMCADKKIPMFLSDDAHHISHVCKHFADAKAYADSFGVNLVGLNKIL